jgi:ribosome-binding factor A
VPELTFLFDESIAGQDRIEQLLNEIRTQAPDADPDDAGD